MADTNQFKVIYALIWRANKPDDKFDQKEFDKRVPRLMAWLKDLYKKHRLVACGGGGFEFHSGGLTLITAKNVEEAIEISKGTPMNEIGTTEVFVWDVYYGNLVELKREEKLKG